MDRRASRTPGRQNLSEKQMCVLGPRSAARGSSPQITRNSSRLELPQAVLRRQQATEPGCDWSVNLWRSADGAPQAQAGPSSLLWEMKEAFPGMFCTGISLAVFCKGRWGYCCWGEAGRVPDTEGGAEVVGMG